MEIVAGKNRTIAGEVIKLTLLEKVAIEDGDLKTDALFTFTLTFLLLNNIQVKFCYCIFFFYI